MKRVESSMGSLGKTAAGVGVSLARVGTVAAVGFGVAAAAATAAALAFVAPVKAASDLEESVNKSAVVFGRASGQVLEFANTSASALGQSRQSAIETTAAVGNLLTSVGLARAKSADMSIGIVKLAADLASFNNIAGGSEAVLGDLQSGLVGETEPLRKYGIAINETTVGLKAVQMGLARTTESVSEAAKVQARYALIVDATKNAQGDFARTSDGMANSVRIITATWQDFVAQIGGLILPGIREVTAALGKQLPSVLPVLVKALQPAADAFNQLAGRIADFIRSDQFPVWAKRVGDEISYTVLALGVLVDAFGQAFTAIARIVLAVGTIIQQAMRLLDPTVRHSPSLVDNVESGFAAIGATIGELPARVIPALQAAGAAMEAFGLAVAGGLAQAAGQTTAALEKQIALLGTDAVVAYRAAAAALAELNVALAAVSAEIKLQEGVLKGLEAGLKAIQVAQKAAAEETRRVSDALQSARDDLSRFSAAVLPGTKAFEAAMGAMEQAARKAQLAIVNFKLGGSLEAATERVNKLRDAWSHAKDMLEQYSHAQLVGTQAASDAAFENQQAQKKIQLQINEGKLAGMDESSLAPLLAELDRLRLIGENINLKDSLDLDPQRRELEKLANRTKELTFDEARKGVIRWRGEVDKTEKSLKRAETAQAAQAKILSKLEADLARVQGEAEKARLEREIATADDLKRIADALDKRVEMPADQIVTGIEQAQARIDELSQAYDAALAKEKLLGVEAEAQQARIDAQRESIAQLNDIHQQLTEQAGVYTAQLQEAEGAAGKLEQALNAAAAAAGKLGAGGGGGISPPTPPPLDLPGMPNTGGDPLGGQEPHEQTALEKRLAALQIALGDKIMTPLKNFQTGLEDVSKAMDDMAKNGQSVAGVVSTLNAEIDKIGPKVEAFKKGFDEKVKPVFDAIDAWMGTKIGQNVTAFGTPWGLMVTAFQAGWTAYRTYVKPFFDAIDTWLGTTIVQNVKAFGVPWALMVTAFQASQKAYDDYVKPAFDAVSAWLGSTLGEKVASFVTGWDKVKGAFEAIKTTYDTYTKLAFDAITKWLSETVGLDASTAETALTGFTNFLKGAFTTAMDAVTLGAFTRMLNIVKSIIDAIERAIKLWRQLAGMDKPPTPSTPTAERANGSGAAITINNTIDARGLPEALITRAVSQPLATAARTLVTSGAL